MVFTTMSWLRLVRMFACITRRCRTLWVALCEHGLSCLDSACGWRTCFEISLEMRLINMVSNGSSLEVLGQVVILVDLTLLCGLLLKFVHVLCDYVLGWFLDLVGRVSASEKG